MLFFKNLTLSLSMQIVRRLEAVQHQMPSLTRNMTTPSMTTASMTGKLDINSKVRLASGYDLPRLGYGVYKTPADVTYSVVQHALKSGYRHVDSAHAYHNEAECIKALLASGIPRSELFFTTKVPPDGISYEGAKKSIEESLEKSKGLEYLDLVLLHAPYGGKEGRLGAWDALVSYVRSGHIRSIGVSNYGVHHLKELEEHIKDRNDKEPGSGGILSVNQVELHPWLARPDIVGWCQERGVVLEAFSPLTRATKFDDERLQKVVKRVGKKEGQVLIRWSLQMGFVPLPKSVTESRIVENIDIYDFELSDEDMKTLDTGEEEHSAWDPTKMD